MGGFNLLVGVVRGGEGGSPRYGGARLRTSASKRATRSSISFSLARITPSFPTGFAFLSVKLSALSAIASSWVARVHIGAQSPLK
jgi:hypothetical protein